MKESLILNFDILREMELSVEEFIFIVNLYIKVENNIIDIDKNKLEQQKFIKIIKKEKKEIIILREKSINLLTFLTTDIEISFDKRIKVVKKRKSKRIINQEIEDRINEYRFI